MASQGQDIHSDHPQVPRIISSLVKKRFLIVGAGFSGLVLAERLSNEYGAECTIVEKRAHIGGNARDEYDAAGVLVHKYGPHYFRSNSMRIVEYLSRFTEWHPVDYKILSYSDGRYWNFPINLNTFEQFLGRESSSEEFEAWLASKRVSIESPANSEEVIVSQVGWELYEKFFKNYTLKQWKKDPKELDASVCGRIPIRTNRDDRYLREEFQAIPKDGYHRMFERMLGVSPSVELLLNTDYRDAVEKIPYDHLIYTGPIDEYFDFCFGPLPYRSLRFENESFGPDELKERVKISGKPGFWQPAMQVNYPNDEEFTRIVEIKHATGQRCDNTTIVREYPADFGPGKEAYYPIPTGETALLYKQYAAKAAELTNVSFVGRLATYRYYNMDQVVGMALAEFDRIKVGLMVN
jgi:UDP-galactopyranose mutase